MNSKKFTEAMSKIDNKYVGEALFYNGTRLAKKSSKRIAALVAAIIAVLGLCGFAADSLHMKLGCLTRGCKNHLPSQ